MKGLTSHLRHTNSCFMNVEWIKCPISEWIYHYYYHSFLCCVHLATFNSVRFQQPVFLEILSIQRRIFLQTSFLSPTRTLSGGWYIKCQSGKYLIPIRPCLPSCFPWRHEPSLLWIFANPTPHSNVLKTALSAVTALKPREHTHQMTFLLSYRWANGGNVLGRWVCYWRKGFQKAAEAHLPLAFPSAGFLPKQGGVSWTYETNPPWRWLVQRQPYHHWACGPS